MASIEPIAGTLGFKNAAHLLKRATFGPTKAEILEFANMTASQAITNMLNTLPVPEPPIDLKTGTNWLPKPDIETNSGDEVLFSYFKTWTMELMRTTGTNLRERMVYFYHTHLPADNSLIMNTTSLYYQNQLYRHYAFGNFKKLFAKLCVDNAMLLYIDNTLNDKDSPNENFAREMLELYTIGKGPQVGPEDYTNYTETDVKEASRVLTGIKHNFEFDTLDTETGLPRGKVSLNSLNQALRHDAGTKTFTSKFGNAQVKPKPEFMEGDLATEEGFFDEIEQMLDMIFLQPETAKFICRKLYRFFVYYKITPEIENDIIVPLANTLRSNDFEIVPVLEQLFKSRHFYDMDNIPTNDDIIGGLIKSPLEIIIGTLRYFKIGLPSEQALLYGPVYNSILRSLKDLGLDYYEPIDVAGYPAYHQEPAYNRNWISPNWLANRYLFIDILLGGIKNESQNILCKLDVLDFVKNTQNISNPADAEVIVEELTRSLLPVAIPTERFSYFLNSLLLNGTTKAQWSSDWAAYSGGSSNGEQLKANLERLVRGIAQSPEFQLF
jgi:uncharacterized protein (DUF1800 family)